MGHLDAEKNIVYILSYNDYINTGHKDKTFNDFCITALHECEHIIHSKVIENDINTCTWEGCACYLTNQYKEVDISKYSLDVIINNPINYPVYYTVVKKIF